MPVFSYLAYPKRGAKQELLDALTHLNHCEVRPAENENILILVTDTPNEDTEKILQKQLKSVASLESLNMTFGHADD